MPRGWAFARFYRPGGQGFELSFCPGGGEFAHQKVAREGWSVLELTDTLAVHKGNKKYVHTNRKKCYICIVCLKLSSRRSGSRFRHGVPLYVPSTDAVH